jgi:ATP-dependent exoDNAse (exonuclease V) beta subunit
MTIHKSKGLEFPVVIFPFAEEDFSKKIKDKLWIPLASPEMDLPRALINNKKEVENYGATAQTIFQTKNQEEILDTINVLYVALNRAEEQLYVISNKIVTPKGEFVTSNLSYYFLNFLQTIGQYEPTKFSYEFGTAERKSKHSEDNSALQSIGIVAQKLNPTKINIAQREALMWGSAQQDAIAFGTILHEIMALIQTKETLDSALEQALELGLLLLSQRDVFKKTIQKIVDHPELSAFFETDGKIYNEQAILKNGAKTIKPDRVVLKGHQAYLLDYKTGEKHEKHRKQITEYEIALQEMNFDVVKKVLVYTGENIEVVTL